MFSYFLDSLCFSYKRHRTHTTLRNFNFRSAPLQHYSDIFSKCLFWAHLSSGTDFRFTVDLLQLLTVLNANSKRFYLLQHYSCLVIAISASDSLSDIMALCKFLLYLFHSVYGHQQGRSQEFTEGVKAGILGESGGRHSPAGSSGRIWKP